MAMLSQVARMEVVVTRTEAEALLLENQLIKSTHPRYNVLLRDDKSYPFVLLTQEPWPRLAMHRGARAIPGRYFGPYPSVGAIRETLNLMHRLFRLRSCEDSVFRNRSRPCLQYQIGRCSAPCVGLVQARDYAESVRRVGLFLDGRSDELTRELDQAMAASSERLDFEEAARIRDLIGAIRKLQARQYVDGRAADLDVLACAMQGSCACVLRSLWRAASRACWSIWRRSAASSWRRSISTRRACSCKVAAVWRAPWATSAWTSARSSPPSGPMTTASGVSDSSAEAAAAGSASARSSSSSTKTAVPFASAATTRSSGTAACTVGTSERPHCRAA
jgi:hypothetical protein